MSAANAISYVSFPNKIIALFVTAESYSKILRARTNSTRTHPWNLFALKTVFGDNGAI
jgi:hypothetical protein